MVDVRDGCRVCGSDGHAGYQCANCSAWSCEPTVACSDMRQRGAATEAATPPTPGPADHTVPPLVDVDGERTEALASTLDLPIIDDIEHLLSHAAECCGPTSDDFGDHIGRAESVRRWLAGGAA